MNDPKLDYRAWAYGKLYAVNTVQYYARYLDAHTPEDMKALADWVRDTGMPLEPPPLAVSGLGVEDEDADA